MRREVLLDRGTDQQVLRDYRRQLSFLLPLAFFLSGLLGYGVARAGLAPLARLARGMEAIRLDALDTPILIPRAPAELQAVIRSLDAMLVRLRAGYERLTRFSSELAHEFRTPVHVLRQQAEVALLSERSPEEYREILRSALEELEDLGRLTEDMLFLAGAEDPRARVNRQTLTVRAELEDVADFLEPLAAEREVRIEVHAPPHLLLLADRMLLRRAIVNLVSNAIRHTSGGGITLTGAEDEGGILIQVEDTGEGIAAAALPHLFNRYSRVPRPHAAHPGRSGLGLSIVRGIARLHGGTAEVTSTIGRGTCVTLRFPISTAEVI